MNMDKFIKKNYMQRELSLAFKNHFFYIALGIGLIIQLFNLYYSYTMVKEYLPSVQVPCYVDHYSVYALWISEDGISMGFVLLKYLFALIVVIPFGWSFPAEIDSGYQNQMLCRITKKTYYTTKYFAVFISGGTCIAIILIANFLLNLLYCPAQPLLCYTLATDIVCGVFCSKLYYTNPLLFCMLWTLISFIWGGVISGLTLFFSNVFKKSIFVMSAPFFIIVLIDILISNYNYSPLDSFLVSGSAHSGLLIFCQIFILFVLGYWIGLRIYLRKEVL